MWYEPALNATVLNQIPDETPEAFHCQAIYVEIADGVHSEAGHNEFSKTHMVCDVWIGSAYYEVYNKWQAGDTIDSSC